MDKNQNTPASNGVAIAKIDPSTPASKGSAFKDYLDKCAPQIAAVCASHLKPSRVAKIVLGCVTRTPALRNCSVGSIVNATMQAVALGLEPGSPTGEAYLVPYGTTCTLIPGYRGLISLAFRSGFVVSIKANVVCQSDTFEYEEGLNPKLRHVPDFEKERDPKLITFAYCVITLKDGGLIYDVMTRGEVDAIRRRSKSGNNGPWVTDYAEMAKKTVTRRALKYAPMSVEMGRALALDAIDAGEGAPADYDMEYVDMETGEVQETKTDKLKGKLGVGEGKEATEALATPDAKALERLTGDFGFSAPEIGDFQTWCAERKLDWTQRAIAAPDKDALYAEEATLV